MAGRLAQGGIRAILLDYRPERAATIAAQGIRIEKRDGSQVVPIEASADPERIGRADIVCICVKAYDTLRAVHSAQPVIARDTLVVSVQNGLGNAELIAAVVGSSRVAVATTGYGVTLLGPGHVAEAGCGSTLIAPFEKTNPEPARQFCELLTAAGFASRFSEDLAGVVWSKLIINAGINPVSAIENVANGEVWERPALRAVALSAALEGERVAAKKGVRLLFQDTAAELAEVCRKTRANVSSMLQDIRAGKRTEIDAINGAIVREGSALAVATPVNAQLVERIYALAAPCRPRHA